MTAAGALCFLSGYPGHSPGDPQAGMESGSKSASCWRTRGEESIAALCRREGIAESLIYRRAKELLEANKKWLTGNTARAAATVPT